MFSSFHVLHRERARTFPPFRPFGGAQALALAHHPSKNRIKPQQSARIESNQSCDLNNIVIMNSKVKKHLNKTFRTASFERSRKTNRSRIVNFVLKSFPSANSLSRDLFYPRKRKTEPQPDWIKLHCKSVWHQIKFDSDSVSVLPNFQCAHTANSKSNLKISFHSLRR